MPNPELITLSCPSCGGQIRVTDNTSHYVCSYCGNEHVVAIPRTREPNTVKERPVVPVPEGVEVERDGRSVRIVRRWFSIKYIPMAFFCLAWDSFLIFWYGMAFSIDAPWIMVVFPIAHVAVGVGLTYSTLAGFLNRSYLEVTPEEIAVWHDPLPWAGEKTLKTSEINQLYTRHMTKNGENGTTHTYELLAVTRDGKTVKLFSGLDSSEIALFMEQRVERWLKISDAPIAGELPR